MTRGDDDGSVLVLVLGTAVVLALLLTVVVDTGRLYLVRRSLDGVTDAAALAGAQAVDLDAVYAGTSAGDLPLDAASARAAVEAHLAAREVEREIDGFRLDEVEVAGDEITVRTSATVRLPFVGPVTGGTTAVIVRTSATARNRVASERS